MEFLPEFVRVLIVDENDKTRNTVAKLLKEKGFIVAGFAKNGFEAIEKNDELVPDVIIMDIEMPEMDGLQAAQNIIFRRAVPIVVLTSLESLDFIKKACDVGTGAYLIKPPRGSELLSAITIARARCDDLIALKRQIEEMQEREINQRSMVAELHDHLVEDLSKIHAIIDDSLSKNKLIGQGIIKFGALQINQDAHFVWYDGRPVDLSATEFALLVNIVSNAPRIVSAEELYRQAQPDNTELWDPNEVIRYHVYRIRKKLKETGAKKDIIRNVRGVGYTCDV